MVYTTSIPRIYHTNSQKFRLLGISLYQEKAGGSVSGSLDFLPRRQAGARDDKNLRFCRLNHRFQAFRADFYALAVDFLILKINEKLPLGSDVGMASGITRCSSPAADGADF